MQRVGGQRQVLRVVPGFWKQTSIEINQYSWTCNSNWMCYKQHAFQMCNFYYPMSSCMCPARRQMPRHTFQTCILCKVHQDLVRKHQYTFNLLISSWPCIVHVLGNNVLTVLLNSTSHGFNVASLSPVHEILAIFCGIPLQFYNSYIMITLVVFVSGTSVSE